jgi:translation elongation factor EF-G
MGMAYTIEEVKHNLEAGKPHPARPSTRDIHFAPRHTPAHTQSGQITGSLISAVRDACRAGLLDWSPRLKLAMYTCDIQATSKQRLSRAETRG